MSAHPAAKGRYSSAGNGRENGLSRRELERKNERLERELEKLRKELHEREKKIADAERRIAEGEKRIAEDGKRIADLERQLALHQQNSTTSSKPPSSDGLAGKPRERGRKGRGKGRRKPGGQPGHAGRNRPLVPAERVDRIVKLYPGKCGCGRRLSQTGLGLETCGGPRRHQVTEIPEIKAHITEYQCHRVVCPDCGKTAAASLPEEFQDGFGPQLTALIAFHSHGLWTGALQQGDPLFSFRCR